MSGGNDDERVTNIINGPVSGQVYQFGTVGNVVFGADGLHVQDGTHGGRDDVAGLGELEDPEQEPSH